MFEKFLGRTGFAFVVSMLVFGSAQAVDVSESTKKLHFDSFVMDLHTDTLLIIEALGYEFGEEHWAPFGMMPWMGHVDLPRAKEGGMDAMFMGLVANPIWGDGGDQIAETLRVAHEDVLERYPDRIELAWNAADLTEITARGKMAIQFLVEGAHGLGSNLSRLDEFYQAGVRSLGLAHFTSNDFAISSAEESRKDGGLTAIGKELIGALNRKGFAIDLAHTHPDSFRDAITLTTAPVIVSHTGISKLRPTFRNLKDWQIKAVAQTGGVIGVMYAPVWLSNNMYPPIQTVVDHMLHVKKLVGAEYLALGSDYDGFIWLPQGMWDVTDQPKLTQVMRDNGFTDDEIRGVLGENIMRVLKEVEAKATERPARPTGPWRPIKRFKSE